MTRSQNDKSDTKLLIAVAGVVATGAIGIALLAAYSVDEPTKTTARNETRLRSVATQSVEPVMPAMAADETTAAPDAFELASLVKDSGSTVGPEIVGVEDNEIEIVVDPDANFIKVGTEAYQARDFATAAAYFTAEVEAHPGRPWTQYMLGLSTWKNDDLSRASAALTEATTLDPDMLRGWINLSRVQNERGEFDAALVAAQAALTVDPADATARFQEARSLRNLGRVDEALVSLEAGIAADGENAYAHNLLGLIRIEQGNPGDAVEPLRRAIELEPEVAYMHNNLGMALELSDDREQAVQSYARASEIAPDHAKAASNLARLQPTIEVEVAGEIEAVESEGTDVADAS
ncbi:MAG: tetratricopeptide repeat protein [bacterium]|nr:tetratricopeptide repeat protein [bacterium]